jgi:hypothetical protein
MSGEEASGLMISRTSGSEAAETNLGREHNEEMIEQPTECHRSHLGINEDIYQTSESDSECLPGKKL